jgi:hypothetical protein
MIMQKANDNTIMAWGAHKGKKLAIIPASYFIWLWDEWGLEKSGDRNSLLIEYVREHLTMFRAEVKREAKQRYR